MGGGASVHSPAKAADSAMHFVGGSEISSIGNGSGQENGSGMDPPPSRPPSIRGTPARDDSGGSRGSPHGAIHARDSEDSGNVRPKLRQRKAEDGRQGENARIATASNTKGRSQCHIAA